MSKIEDKYLPAGTVVRLKDGKKRVMIIGFCIKEEKDNSRVWDYSGCIFPEGLLSSDHVCLFDHEQIDKVFYYGLIDDEEENFKANLKKIKKEEENNN